MGCLSYLHTRVFQKARRIRRFTAKGFGKYSHGCWPKFLASMAKVFPTSMCGVFVFTLHSATHRVRVAPRLYSTINNSRNQRVYVMAISNCPTLYNLFISTCRYQSVYVNMSISTCLYQIVKSTCLNHLFCHSFDITSSASLLLPTCVWRGRDGTWWPRQILVSPATERSARFLCLRVSGMFPCVAGAAFCGSGHPLVSPVPARAGMRPWFFLAWQAAGNHLCRRRPHVLVCGRNASLHARRSIMSTSTWSISHLLF